MKTFPYSYLAFAYVSLASLTTLTQAAIIVVAPTNTIPGSIEITEDITFTITTDGEVKKFVFDDWVLSDGGQAYSTIFPHVEFSLNSVSQSPLDLDLIDNLAFDDNDLNSDDGYLEIYANELGVLEGDTLTLIAGTYEISTPYMGDLSFNALATQTFTGNMFIANMNNERISDIVKVADIAAVPEPSTLGLLMGGVTMALGFLRRREA